MVTGPLVGRECGRLLYLKKSTCSGLIRYSSTLELVEVRGGERTRFKGEERKVNGWGGEKRREEKRNQGRR